MSSTYRPSDAFDYAKEFIKKMPLESVSARLLDDVSRIMWMAAPWRWTIGSMPVVGPLVANQRDYDLTTNVPVDFLYLVSGYISDGSTSPQHLRVASTISNQVTYGLVGPPTEFAQMGTNMRFNPMPGNLPPTPQYVVSLYKKQAPMITQSSQYLAGTQVFDDEWFWVFREGVLWKAFQFAEDERAGNVQVQDGKITSSGQRAVFDAALEFMRASEPLPMLTTQPEPAKTRG